jgi:hypothetical protein
MSGTYEMNGTVKTVSDKQTFSSGFEKREFVITTDDKYPHNVKFECIKERCSLLDNVHEGDGVDVSFRIRGSEYNGKFFVNLQAFEVKVAGSNGGAGRPPADDEEPRAARPRGNEPEEDMPF